MVVVHAQKAYVETVVVNGPTQKAHTLREAKNVESAGNYTTLQECAVQMAKFNSPPHKINDKGGTIYGQ